MRLRIPPGDIPIEAAARHMGISVERFRQLLPSLLARGFPPADETTGNYSLEAIDEWRRRRFPRLFRPTVGGDTEPTHEEVMERIRRL
jgi:hypothetical protein